MPRQGTRAPSFRDRTFAGTLPSAVQAPRLPAQFSLFRQRGPRGFDLVTRYYDPLKEAREERLRKAGKEGRDARRELFSARMRHSWQRHGSDRAHLVRLVVVMGLVIAILYFIVKSFALLDL